MGNVIHTIILPVAFATSLAILATTSGSALAYNSCTTPSDSDLSACLTSTNNDLKNIYETLISNSDEHERTALRNEERDWIKQRNQQCSLILDKDFFAPEEWVWSIVDDNEKNRLTKSRCVVNLTRERITLLEPRNNAKQADIEKLLAEYESKRNTPYHPPIIPTASKTLLDFIPRGYAVLEKIEADFNGDHKEDVAMILGTVPEYDLYPKPFLILFANPAGGYTLSVRNDHIAPTGEGGGIANPHGANALKSKGRSILIEESGGGSTSLSGHIDEFSYQNGDWYRISTEEWSSLRDGRDIHVSSDGWGIYQTSTHTDLVTGKVTNIESWSNVNTQKSREEIKRGEDVSPKQLVRLGDIQQ